MSNAEDASIPNEEMDDGINENAAATNEEVTVNQEDNTIVQDVPVLEAFDGPFDFEVVGLQMISNGRQCCNHNVCDDHLGVGDVIKLVGTIVTNNDGRDEGALTVHKIIDGTVEKLLMVPWVAEWGLFPGYKQPFCNVDFHNLRLYIVLITLQ